MNSTSWSDRFVTVSCAALFGAALLATLNGTFDTLTKRDCAAGIQAACLQLQK